MPVHYQPASGIATITLDAAHNRNALSAELVDALSGHLRAAAADGDVRAVVLTHTGGTFCSGADLTEQSAEGGPAQGTARMLGVLREIVELAKPVVARIDGHVRAGGIGLVGACDIAIAGPRSSFAFTEVRLGLAPAIISLTTLGRMTERAASRYYLTGETFDARAAADAGLVTAAADDLDAVVDTICAALRLGVPQGLSATKPLTTVTAVAAFDERAEAMRSLSQHLFESDEARAAMDAFRRRRPE